MKTPKINFEPLPAAAGSVRDTPRTDWREARSEGLHDEWCFSLCRQLERELNTCREALEAADECLSLIEDVGHGAMSDNVTVARGIVLAALSQNDQGHTQTGAKND
jgi:hypothetical protein